MYSRARIDRENPRRSSSSDARPLGQGCVSNRKADEVEQPCEPTPDWAQGLGRALPQGHCRTRRDWCAQGWIRYTRWS
jgi:hypothetical protein